MESISAVDISVIGVYFTLIFGLGLYFALSGKKTSADYFLAGRHVGWFAIGASLFATNISSEHFIGLAGTGASSGLAVGHFEWQACLILLLLGWVFTPFYLRSGVFTMPEFLERRFNASCRWYLTSISIVAYILTKISVTLFAGGFLLQQVMGWDMFQSALIMVIFTGLYTIAGGLRAVIYTELAQTFILIGGAVAITVLGLIEVGGLTGLRAKIPATHFEMFKPIDHPDFPWTGIVFGAPIISIWYWCTDQFIVQRVLSARNLGHAQAGTVFAGFLKILPVFILIFPGMIALGLYPEAQGDAAFPVLVNRLLPEGLKGLVIAGLLAALMSSLASCFNSASTLFTIDVYKKLNPAASEKRLVLIGRTSTLVVVLLGIAWIPLIKYISTELYLYMQNVQAYLSPPIATVFLLGVFWRRANATGALATLIVGMVLGASRFVLQIYHKNSPLEDGIIRYLTEINFLHFSILMMVVCIVTMIVVSLMTSPPPADKTHGLIYDNEPVTSTDSAALTYISPKMRILNITFAVILTVVLFALWAWFF